MKLKYASWLPAVILMAVIYCFSNKPANDSNQTSLTIVDKIITLCEDINNSPYAEEKKTELSDQLNYIVRKTAHFCEYALLAILFALHLAIWKHRRKQLFWLPVALSCFYAMTDEFHQIFIPGRAGQLKDVLLDTSGAAVGAMFFLLLLRLFHHWRRKKRQLTAS